jgi:dTDP-4-dehydrorhamnose reductase
LRILLIGGNGMLGRDVGDAFDTEDVAKPSSHELNVLDMETLRAGCRRIRPELIISTMAFHRVDDAEMDSENAFLMNAVATRHIAYAAREFGARMAWVSTDYVFNGRASEPYEPDVPVDPLNVYGASKAAGECLIRMTTPDHLIFRASGLYGLHRSGAKRTNFVDSILRLAKGGREEISVVRDQVCTPTYTKDFAQTFAALVKTGATGTFHVTNTGEASWSEFAEAILKLAGYGTRVRPVTSAEYAATAKRPAYSTLGHKALLAAGVPAPRPWMEALPEFIRGRAEQGELGL